MEHKLELPGAHTLLHLVCILHWPESLARVCWRSLPTQGRSHRSSIKVSTWPLSPQAFWMLTNFDHLKMGRACCNQVYHRHSDHTMINLAKQYSSALLLPSECTRNGLKILNFPGKLASSTGTHKCKCHAHIGSSPFAWPLEISWLRPCYYIILLCTWAESTWPAVDRCDQQNHSICDTCGPCPTIQSIVKAVFHQFLQVCCIVKSLRCLDLAIWQFSWWQQTDRQNRLLYPWCMRTG